jgi:tetraacyldisaccharide 4'-kinase
MNIPRPLAILLWPLSLVYGSAASLRAWLYKCGWLKQKRLNRPVISVGNITVGGTGKTPLVIWLAERLLADGKRVAILSRGYRGSDGTSDEIELMKQRLQGRVMFGVGPDRYAQGRRLERASVDVFILDDGFQHLQLARDVDIVLIDGSREFRDAMFLPAGLLREPHSALARADAVIYTRMSRSPESSGMIARIRDTQRYPFFTSETRLLGFRRIGSSENWCTREEMGEGPFFAFCGIGNPEAFFLDLRRWGLVIAGSRAFSDHHKYTAAEAHKLEDAAMQAGATAIVTTEKDSYNLIGTSFARIPVYICAISLDVIDENQFLSIVGPKIRQHQGAAV